MCDDYRRRLLALLRARAVALALASDPIGQAILASRARRRDV